MINNQNYDDTIVALATAAGKSAIAIVRLSGKDSLKIARSIFKGSELNDRVMAYGHIADNENIIDEVNIVYMKAPKTYTGEDTVEIYCHGSIYIAQRIVETAVKNGARLALPGEFTKTAFLNGKLDLSQAEAVIDVINSSTKSAKDVALNQLSGRLKSSISELTSLLTKCIARIEVTVDYPEEDIEDLTIDESLETVDIVINYVKKLLLQSERGKVFKNGLRCAIVGQPNVGKSSLLNAILGESRAIVTPIAGTTRDTLETHIDISGVEVILTDTAGIRKSEDFVEKIGVDRAYQAAENAQIILFVLDMSRNISNEDIELYNNIKSKPHIIVLNKEDATITDYYMQLEELNTDNTNNIVTISASSGKGISNLEDKIIELFNEDSSLLPSEIELSNVRHIDAVHRAEKSLLMARDTLQSRVPVDMAVVDLKGALLALGEITGANVDEDVIDTIFSEFCVGK
ncbi:MAG: tRNA uridine-5-carboxymethylaminomethyl(34) synthesis GTPase MnmE [Clostridia bacterium]|nr:tRNA uridine-5-carboxymethylaminomethyl(34) synthesis GTPase MnmE [Clostridia bacterium]